MRKQNSVLRGLITAVMAIPNIITAVTQTKGKGREVTDVSMSSRSHHGRDENRDDHCGSKFQA